MVVCGVIYRDPETTSGDHFTKDARLIRQMVFAIEDQQDFLRRECDAIYLENSSIFAICECWRQMFSSDSGNLLSKQA